MSNCYLQLRRIAFSGPEKNAELTFDSGVNVICGASDTGKSFLAESIDFMLGRAQLREIPERVPYEKIALDLHVNSGEIWQISRSTSGGNFKLIGLTLRESPGETLKEKHSHDKTDNLSGFLLDKIGLLSKRILKNARGTTVSLSFRNIARLIIVQEVEIQQTASPFLGGQYTQKTAELAAIRLLLTGVDDSSVVEDEMSETDTDGQISLIDELLVDLESEIADMGEDKGDLTDQLSKLEETIESERDSLSQSQRKLNELLSERREILEHRQVVQGRLDEISDLLARFALLEEHYAVDIERLKAIEESGSMFAHVEPAPCPLCGAKPEDQHHDETCDGDVEAVIAAATAEIHKIEQLSKELASTVSDLRTESESLANDLSHINAEYNRFDKEIQEAVSPQVNELRASFSDLIEKRSTIQKGIDLFERVEKLEVRKLSLESEEGDISGRSKMTAGLPKAIAHEFSLKVTSILKAWNFPGECRVHFDKETTDFVIDGKPRGSRGKGLRAIIHAAVTIGLLEYCQENQLPHPGFVVLDSPLLAYFEPEGDDALMLKGTDLEERFYEYLIDRHKNDSQIIIIENQHPPTSIQDRLTMTVFTGNPNKDRFGLL